MRAEFGLRMFAVSGNETDPGNNYIRETLQVFGRKVPPPKHLGLTVHISIAEADHGALQGGANHSHRCCQTNPKSYTSQGHRRGDVERPRMTREFCNSMELVSTDSDILITHLPRLHCIDFARGGPKTPYFTPLHPILCILDISYKSSICSYLGKCRIGLKIPRSLRS